MYIYKEYSLFTKCLTSFCRENVTPVVTVALCQRRRCDLISANGGRNESRFVSSSTGFQQSMTTKFGPTKVLKSDERLCRSIRVAHWQERYRNVLLCNP